ncbi:MAG: hypothetical protein H6714_05065 [Myxococcales bacterium]|nr:hypothetical protein [Myxococcales bacterium]
MKTSPLAQVKAQFKSKSDLVKAVRALGTDALWVDRLNKDKSLERVPNAKLLHLHAVLSEVKSAFGSREKLIDAILKAEGYAKDKDLLSSLSHFSTPKLLERHKSVAKRTKKSSAGK